MAALTFEMFKKLMAPFQINSGDKIAVGVSGGADSLCLTLFLSQWAQENNVYLTALTVNHNLRAEAAAEAEETHCFLTQKGIFHQTLVNQEPIPVGGIEAYARQIRYNLLIDYCKQQNIRYLFLAHHLSDQVETFFLRLSKSSGLKGLGGMRFQTNLNGVVICRPFLSVPKELLTQALKRQNVVWAEDKMNYDLRFERVKWRLFLPQLNQQGLSSEAVFESMQRLQRADEAIDEYVLRFIEKEVWIDFRGFARLPVEAWKDCPLEVRLRILETLIKCIGRQNKFISMQAIEKLAEELPSSKTLGGCAFKAHKTGLFIYREQREIEPKKLLVKGKTTLWDRFLITPNFNGFVLAGAPVKKLPTLPKAVQNTFPAVFMQKELEKPIQIDYKEKNDSNVKIEFIGKCKDNGK